jgi:outer membrane immunogenic protein
MESSERRKHTGLTTMKKLLLWTLLATTAAVAHGAAPSIAADLPARTYGNPPPILAPIYDWSGFYVGINGGGGSSHNCWDLTNDGTAPVIPSVAEGCHNATGATFGGQIGYRWQSAAWVFGVEAQGNWADFRGDNVSLFFNTDRNQTRLDSFGLFTGQIGYAWNNALIYVKGGGAVTSTQYNIIDIPSGGLIDTTHETRWGGTAGTGFEFGISPSVSVAFEYDHLFMGSRDVNFPIAGSDHVSQDADLFTARFNYRFGGPVVARY